MTDNTWPDPARPGVPLNPERDQFHWLIRKNGQWPEAWRWDPDADGCGTEYSGAWAESEGDGQPEDMGKWYRYLGPCLTPAEVDARVKEAEAKIAAGCLISNAAEVADLVAQAKRDALIKAAARVSNYAVTAHQHGSLPIDPHECAKQVAWEITASITAMAEKGEGDE